MMTRFEWGLVVCVAVAAAACGGGSSEAADGGGISITDARGGPDAGSIAACNPVGQTGCDPNEKCANVVVMEGNPDLAVTKCVPDGSVDEDAACTHGTVGEDTGYDNCKAGFACRSDTCREICQQAPNSCSVGNCVQISSYFQDAEGVGLCAPPCDPVAQDCPGTDACFIRTGTGDSSCSRVPPEAANLKQDDDCYGPSGGGCYINGCSEGFAPILNKGGPDGAGGSVCTAFCSPVVQHSGETSALGGDPNGVTCASRGAVSSHCRFINTFYGNTDKVSDAVGFCVPPDLWGDCKDHTLGSQDPETRVVGCQPVSDFQAAPAPGTPAQSALPEYKGDVGVLMNHAPQ